MGETPDQIKVKMDTTKSQIADTVDQLTATAATSATKAQDALVDAGHGVSQNVASTVDAVNRSVTSKRPLFVAAGVAVGAFGLGYLVPLTSIEKMRLRPIGDDLARRGEQARDEVVNQGKAVIEETVAAARSSFKTHADEAAQNLGVAENRG